MAREDELREALRPFAAAGNLFLPVSPGDSSEYCQVPDSDPVGDRLVWRTTPLTIGDLRRAARVLSGDETETTPRPSKGGPGTLVSTERALLEIGSRGGIEEAARNLASDTRVWSSAPVQGIRHDDETIYVQLPDLRVVHGDVARLVVSGWAGYPVRLEQRAPVVAAKTEGDRMLLAHSMFDPPVPPVRRPEPTRLECHRDSGNGPRLPCLNAIVCTEARNCLGGLAEEDPARIRFEVRLQERRWQRYRVHARGHEPAVVCAPSFGVACVVYLVSQPLGSQDRPWTKEELHRPLTCTRTHAAADAQFTREGVGTILDGEVEYSAADRNDEYRYVFPKDWDGVVPQVEGGLSAEYVAFLRRQWEWTPEQIIGLHHLLVRYGLTVGTVAPAGTARLLLSDGRHALYQDRCAMPWDQYVLLLGSSLRGDWSEEAVAYADGSGVPTDLSVGAGVMLQTGPPGTFEVSESLGPGTNNVAELRALWRALTMVPDSHQAVEIRSDSQYAIGCATNQNWSITANRALVEIIREEIARRRRVTFRHVKGHAGDPGNERADYLAGQARRKQLQIIIEQGEPE